MITYKLIDTDGSEFVFSDNTTVENSMSLSGESFSFENDIVENTYLPGSKKLGTTRVEERSLTISFTRTYSANYKTQINSLCQFLTKVKYIEDTTNSLRMEIAVVGYDVDYADGVYQKVSKEKITVTCLKPYWTSTSITTYTLDDILNNTLTNLEIVNSGNAPAFPTITMTVDMTTAELEEVDIYISELNEGISKSTTVPIWGSSASYYVLVINCLDGTVISDDVDLAMDINGGSGYFSIPTGTSNMKFIMGKSGGSDGWKVDAVITFYANYYI